MLRRFTVRRSAAIATAAAAGLVTVGVVCATPALADDCGYTTAPFTITADLTSCAIDAGGTLVTLGGSSTITVQNSTISNASAVLFAGNVLGSGLSLSSVTGSVTQVAATDLATVALSSVAGPVTLSNAANDFGSVDLRTVGAGGTITLFDANVLTVDLTSAATGRTPASSAAISW